MHNWLLQAYCLKLYDDIAKFLSVQQKNCRIAVIENCINNEKLQAVNFIRAGKKYSLPFVVFNKELHIITKENISSIDFYRFELVLSLFNIHSLAKEEQISFIKKMQKMAPQAIFLDYENPERNLAYLGYFSFVLSQYITCCLEKLFMPQEESLLHFQEYLKNGALEGVLYEMSAFLPENSIKIFNRKHYGLGSIGMASVEW